MKSRKIKYLYVGAAAAVIALVAAILVFYIHRSSQPPKHLFILSGQSNMARLFVNESFTPVIRKELGEGRFIIVRDTDRQSQYGKSIKNWYKKWQPLAGENQKPKADMYEQLMAKVNAAIRFQKIKTVTFVWMQGERDAKEKHGEVYAASLEGLITQLEEDLGRRNINVVIGRLSDHGLTNAEYPDWAIIRDAQVNVAEANPHRTWVNTDDLNDGKNRDGNEIKNDLHYSADGYTILGQRFANAAITLIKKQN